MTDEELLKFKEDCFKEVENKQVALITKYNLGKYDEYLYDQSKNIIKFRKNGKLKSEFIFIPVGSWLDNIWLWAWADESVTEELRLESARLKELFEITGMDLFKTESFEIPDENLIHEITAITVHHLNALGMYLAHDDNKLFLALMKKV